MPVNKQALYDDFVFLYGEDRAAHYAPKLFSKLVAFERDHPELKSTGPYPCFSEQDAILITYGDMVGAQDASPLRTLADFLSKHVGDAINTVHILPFFPYSSDDGFSVIDYCKVDPALGDWSDIQYLGESYKLVFDAVINHISSESAWFQAFLNGDPAYKDFFIRIPDSLDLSQVFRPRALPLKTQVQTISGDETVWTTFSDDQIDLNYKSPELLLAVLDVLLFYVEQGAAYFRLDAIAFIWKESGTSCIHLPETHRIVQLIRKVLDWVAPGVAIITETNVPHSENISYFGDGRNEAQLVYNFPLPPLTLHTFFSGNAQVLSEWAQTLTLPSKETTFLNFLSSHDGIGVTPVRGILSDQAVSDMCQRVESLGGYVSYRTNPDGSKSPYELNINFLEALRDPGKPMAEDTLLASRFLASQAIMLTLRGIPGIFFHSLFGSTNWIEGVEQTGRARSINRQKIPAWQLEHELSETGTIRNQVFYAYLKLLEKRRRHPAFHPTSEQKLLFVHPAVFALQRYTQDRSSQILCLHNVSGDRLNFRVETSALCDPSIQRLEDVLSGRVYQLENEGFVFVLEPYEVLWLTS